MDRERARASKKEKRHWGKRERKSDGSASCFRAKVGLCFREGNIVNLQ